MAYANYTLWLVAAHAALKARWGIDYTDAGADDLELARFYKAHTEGESVEDLALWYGEHFDFNEPDPWTARALREANPIPAP